MHMGVSFNLSYYFLKLLVALSFGVLSRHKHVYHFIL